MWYVCKPFSNELMTYTSHRTPRLRSRVRGRASTGLAGIACIGALVSGSLASPSRTLAHAPAEVLEFVSDKPDDVILSTNRGLIFGNPATGSWTLLCNEALDVSISRPYRTALLPSGRLLVGESIGIRYTDDRGCTVRGLESLAGLSTPDFAQDPTEPKRVFVTTAGTGQNTVRVSDDEGGTFRTLLTGSEDDYFANLLVVPSSPVQVYVSLIVLDPMGNYKYALVHSADAGVTWTRSEVVLEDSERDLTLLAANPANPLELLARATNVEPAAGERLMWSRDGGKTFSSPIKLSALRAAAFSSDGQVAYAGGKDGLWQARDEARTFVQVPATARVSALDVVGDKLLAGAYYKGIDAPEDGVGIASASNLEFAPFVNFNQVSQHATCPAPSMADKLCESLWRDWMVENPVLGSGPDAGAGAGTDAGTGVDASVAAPDAAGAAPDAGTRPGADSDASTSGPDESGGCSCNVGGRTSGQSAANGLGLSLLVLLAMRLFRRRQAR